MGKATITRKGLSLPDLTSPASAGEVLEGKQSINQEGEIIVGTMPSLQKATSDATATPAHINYGKTAYVNGDKITGTGNNLVNSGVAVITEQTVDLPIGTFIAGTIVTVDVPLRAGYDTMLSYVVYDWGGSHDFYEVVAQSIITEGETKKLRLNIKSHVYAEIGPTYRALFYVIVTQYHTYIGSTPVTIQSKVMPILSGLTLQ